MSKNTTYVTHPDGSVSKRTSATRAYTHAVEVAVTDDSEIARLQRENADWAKRLPTYTDQSTVDQVNKYIFRNQEKMMQFTPGRVQYFVLQWSASLKSASAAARKPFWNTDGKSSRVVEVDA